MRHTSVLAPLYHGHIKKPAPMGGTLRTFDDVDQLNSDSASVPGSRAQGFCG